MGYVIQCRESDDMICYCDTYEEAQEELSQFEEDDRREGVFEEDFYEIMEVNWEGIHESSF